VSWSKTNQRLSKRGATIRRYKNARLHQLKSLRIGGRAPAVANFAERWLGKHCSPSLVSSRSFYVAKLVRGLLTTKLALVESEL